MVLLVVDYAKLTRCHALYQLVGMDDELALARALKHSRMVFGRMANLEAHTCRCARLTPRVERKKVEIVYGEVLLVSGTRFETLTHIQHIVGYILFHDVPRTATEAESVALSDGVEPQTAVLAYKPARLQFEYFARLLAEELAYVVVMFILP